MFSQILKTAVFFLAVLLAARGAAGADENAREQQVPKDTAILELSVPAGARVAIDGQDKGAKRLFTYRGLAKGQIYPYEVEILSPDGSSVKRTMLLSGGWSVRLPLRPADNARLELVAQTGHSDGVNCVVYSPDGRYVLTGSRDNTAILWDATTGLQLRVFTGHTKGVAAVAFAAEGKQVLTASYDRTIIVWEAESGRKLRTFQHNDELSSLAVSPDGKLVLAGSRGEGVLWDAAAGNKLRTFGNKNQMPETNGAFSSDGRQVFIAPGGLWDVASGKSLDHFSEPAFYNTAVAFSSDGKWVLTGVSEYKMDKRFCTAFLWDAATGKKLRLLQGHTDEIHTVSFSPDGSRILTASKDKTAILWETATGNKLHTFAGRWAAFSPDGTRVVTIPAAPRPNAYQALTEKTAVTWDAMTKQKLQVFQGFTANVRSLALSSDGAKILSGSEDMTAQLWDLAKGRALRSFRGHTDTVISVAFSPDGTQVLTGSWNEKVAVLWNAATGEKQRAFQTPNPILAVAFSPNGEHILIGAFPKATLWDKTTGQELHSFQGRHLLFFLQMRDSASFSADGKRVLARSDELTATLWDATTGEKIRDFQDHAKKSIVDSDYVRSAAPSPDGKQVITGHEKKATLWDADTAEKLRVLQGHLGWLTSTAFSPDGNEVLTAASDGKAILWDKDTGEKLRTFQGHTDQINAAIFFPNDKTIATCSKDATVRLWDVATGDELARLIAIDGGQDWVVATPEGLFDGSKGGREKSYFRDGNGLKIVPLDNFFQDFYYPGLLAAIWRGERPMPGKPFQVSPAPSVKMLVNQESGVRNQESGVRNQESDKKDRVTIDVAVTDQGGGLKAPWLKHNRAAVRAANTLVRKDGRTENHRFSVALVPGENHVEARAATADGSVESEPAAITIPFDGKLPDPELHVVAVGINLYAPNAGVKNLRYCVADAEGIADLLQKRAAKSYGKVHVTRLLDDKATKAEILKILSDLAKTVKPQDTLVFFCASHGVTLGQRYFLIPHDLKMGEENPREDLRKGALAVDELSEPLAAVPALKRVLIFDTCESGSATSLAGKDNNPFAFRGAAERLNRAQGVYCLAGATATEKAAESRDLKHSILTYTLLAGAGAVDKGPLAGLKVKGGEGERGLDVLDWFRYARQNVPMVYEEVRGKAQNIEISGEDQPGFPLLAPAGK